MFKKILVALDGSEPSNNALSFAIELASTWSAELLILSVMPPESKLFYASSGTPLINVEEYLESLRKVYLKVLKDAEKKVEEGHPEINVSTVLRKGHVSSEIIDAADSEEVDLIVMGSRGLSGIKSWFLGSTSKNVVEHCKKPIFIVK